MNNIPICALLCCAAVLILVTSCSCAPPIMGDGASRAIRPGSLRLTSRNNRPETIFAVYTVASYSKEKEGAYFRTAIDKLRELANVPHLTSVAIIISDHSEPPAHDSNSRAIKVISVISLADALHNDRQDAVNALLQNRIEHPYVWDDATGSGRWIAP